MRKLKEKVIRLIRHMLRRSEPVQPEEVRAEGDNWPVLDMPARRSPKGAGGDVFRVGRMEAANGKKKE